MSSPFGETLSNSKIMEGEEFHGEKNTPVIACLDHVHRDEVNMLAPAWFKCAFINH